MGVDIPKIRWTLSLMETFVATTPSSSRHLAAAMLARLRDWPETDREVYERVGMSPAQWDNMKNARRDGYHRTSFLKLDDALCWVHGSAARVFEDGGDPEVDHEATARVLAGRDRLPIPPGGRVIRRDWYTVVVQPGDTRTDDEILRDIGP